MHNADSSKSLLDLSRKEPPLPQAPPGPAHAAAKTSPVSESRGGIKKRKKKSRPRGTWDFLHDITRERRLLSSTMTNSREKAAATEAPAQANKSHSLTLNYLEQALQPHVGA